MASADPSKNRRAHTQHQPLATAVAAITARSSHKESGCCTLRIVWIPCMYCPPRPVHMDEATNAAPMQKARWSPWAKMIPVTSQPVATNQNAPTSNRLKAVGMMATKAHQTAKTVVATSSVRMLNREGTRGSEGAGLVLRDWGWMLMRLPS